MKILKLGDYLEAVDMGENQQDLAEWVTSSPKWQRHVERVNLMPIPCAEGDGIPDEEWFDKQTLCPDDLLAEACDKLGWWSQPQVGGLIEYYYYEEVGGRGWGESHIATSYVYQIIRDTLACKTKQQMVSFLTSHGESLEANFRVDTGMDLMAFMEYVDNYVDNEGEHTSKYLPVDFSMSSSISDDFSMSSSISEHKAMPVFTGYLIDGEGFNGHMQPYTSRAAFEEICEYFQTVEGDTEESDLLKAFKALEPNEDGKYFVGFQLPWVGRGIPET